MMKKLVKAGEARSELVENFLHTEIFEIPQCLSANQNPLSHGTKSHVTSQIRTISKPSFHLTKSGIVLKLSMLLHKKRVSSVKFDIVTDRYFPEYLKEGFNKFTAFSENFGNRFSN